MQFRPSAVVLTVRRASTGAVVYIENLDFADCIRRYDCPHTVFFCDPPYWQAAGYGVPFEWPDHERLAQTLRKIKGKFLLTINDHPDIKQLYKPLHSRRVPMRYTVRRHGDQRTHELLFANYPLPKRW